MCARGGEAVNVRNPLAAQIGVAEPEPTGAELSQGKLMGCHCRSPLAGQPFGLRGQVTGDALVDPALELGGQVKKFDSHGKVP
jgi:hypothetical protein